TTSGPHNLLTRVRRDFEGTTPLPATSIGPGASDARTSLSPVTGRANNGPLTSRIHESTFEESISTEATGTEDGHDECEDAYRQIEFVPGIHRGRIKDIPPGD